MSTGWMAQHAWASGLCPSTNGAIAPASWSGSTQTGGTSTDPVAPLMTAGASTCINPVRWLSTTRTNNVA